MYTMYTKLISSLGFVDNILHSVAAHPVVLRLFNCVLLPKRAGRARRISVLKALLTVMTSW